MAVELRDANLTPEEIMSKLADNFCEVKGRPFLKDALSFFGSSKSFRLFLTVCDNDSWLDDLAVAEKMLANIVVSCSDPDFDAMYDKAKEVLKQRLRYPNIKEDPVWLSVAKTWILQQKVSRTVSPSELRTNFRSHLKRVCDELGNTEEKLSCVKVELSNGAERSFVYQLLDEGYRPSMLLIKWSYDLDTDHGTAYCAAHIMNHGYMHALRCGDYSLYLFNGRCLYDQVSFKEPSFSHPLVDFFTEMAQQAYKHGVKQSTQSADGSSS